MPEFPGAVRRVVGVLVLALVVVGALVLAGTADDDDGSFAPFLAGTGSADPTTPPTTVPVLGQGGPPTCDLADRLRLAGRAEEAEATYLAVLDQAGDPRCVQRGLDALAEAAAGAPEPPGEPSVADATLDGVNALVEDAPVLYGVDLAWPDVAVVVAVLAGASVLVWRARNRDEVRKHPGRVDVTEVEDGPGDGKVGTKGLTAALRTTLGDVKLFTATALPVPEGEAALKVLEEAPLATLSTVGKALAWAAKAVRAEPVTHSVTTVLRTRSEVPSSGATVQVVDGRTGEVEALTTVWAEGYDDAVERAAFVVAAAVLSHRPEVERRFHAEGYEALRLHHAMNAAGERGEFVAAVAAGRKAMALEPGNLEIRLDTANWCEVAGATAVSAAAGAAGAADRSRALAHFLDALDLYLPALDRWPDRHQPRYRVAATLAFISPLGSAWLEREQPDHSGHEQLVRVRAQLQDLGLDEAGPFAAEVLRLAIRQYRRLEQALYFSRAPLGRAATTARLVTEVQLRAHGGGDPWPELRDQLERAVGGSRGPKEPHYNAACFHARRIPLAATEGTRSGAVEAAIGHLDRFLDAGRMSVAERRWLEVDPDLAPLRDLPAGPERAAWERWASRALGTVPWPSGDAPGGLVRRWALRSGIGVAAAHAVETWRARAAGAAPWASLDVAERATALADEAACWRALADGLAHPGDPDRLAGFLGAAGVEVDVDDLWPRAVVLPAGDVTTKTGDHDAAFGALHERAAAVAHEVGRWAEQATSASFGLDVPPGRPAVWEQARTLERRWRAVAAWLVTWAPPAVDDDLEGRGTARERLEQLLPASPTP